MLFDHITSLYVPLLYLLMTHKNEALYRHAFNAIVAISVRKIKVCSYCSDFEVSLMKQLDIAFGGSFGGFHVGCFFPFQAGFEKASLRQVEYAEGTYQVSNAFRYEFSLPFGSAEM
jgi:hypothetical protein